MVEFTLRARGKTTGLDFGQDAVMVWELRDGLAIRLYLYPTLEQALSALERESSRSDRVPDTARAARDAYNARDADAFAAVWNPDCEWHPFLTARVEGDPGYHGHNGIRAWFEDVDEMFSEIHVELGPIREVGDRLLVLGQMTATGRGSGLEVSSEVGWVVEPRGEQLPARLGLHEP